MRSLHGTCAVEVRRCALACLAKRQAAGAPRMQRPGSAWSVHAASQSLLGSEGACTRTCMCMWRNLRLCTRQNSGRAPCTSVCVEFEACSTAKAVGSTISWGARRSWKVIRESHRMSCMPTNPIARTLMPVPADALRTKRLSSQRGCGLKRQKRMRCDDGAVTTHWPGRQAASLSRKRSRGSSMHAPCTCAGGAFWDLCCRWLAVHLCQSAAGHHHVRSCAP